jgi:hypothetical protein
MPAQGPEHLDPTNSGGWPGPGMDAGEPRSENHFGRVAAKLMAFAGFAIAYLYLKPG